MDLLAALALVLVLEGLALAVLARSLPELLAEIDRISPETMRKIGLGLVFCGAGLYFVIRRTAIGG